MPVHGRAVDARVEDFLDEDVTLAAGLGDHRPADPGIRILVRKDVVDTVAVVAARSHDETVHQQRLAVDRIDEVRYGLVVIDRAGLENQLALVTLGAGLVEVELVRSGLSIRGREDCVVAVAVLAGRGLVVPLRVPLPVDAAVVLRHHIAVALGAGAIQSQRLPLVVGRILEVPRAAVTIGAALILVDGPQENRLVHEELELLAAIGVRLGLLVSVTLQAVDILELLVVALGVDEFFDLVRGRGSGDEKDADQRAEGENQPQSHVSLSVAIHATSTSPTGSRPSHFVVEGPTSHAPNGAGARPTRES